MKNFETLLDRYGSDFNSWPKSEADNAKRFLLSSGEARRAYDRLTQLESWIAASQPRVSDESVRRVVNRSVHAVRNRAPVLSLIDRFRILMAAPMPRVAFVMGLTAVGFGLGVALGAPEIGAVEGTGGPLMTASADDVLF